MRFYCYMIITIVNKYDKIGFGVKLGIVKRFLNLEHSHQQLQKF